MEMDHGAKAWTFNRQWPKKDLNTADNKLTVRAAMGLIYSKLNPNDPRPIIPLGAGDPSAFPCFRPPATAVDAVVDAVRSSKFNGYCLGQGFLPARRAVAEYISKDLPYELIPDDVYLTVGCKQAIQAAVSALAHPDANILLPRPTFAMYDTAAEFSGLEVRHYTLLPEKGWEVDLESVEALADENTAAMVIINPGNPCGSVYTYEHLEKVAEAARKLGLLVIADEVYDHITYGTTPFVRMGVFASRVPVLTIGSISKRWLVPGWRLGWLVTTDPNGILQKSGLWERIHSFFGLGCDPPTFIQAAIPEIIEKTKPEFYSNVIDILGQNAEFIYEKVKEIPYITCPHKPDGSMFAMVKLNVPLLNDIEDDTDLSFKLAREENVIILPGSTIGMKNWFRVTFALEPSLLEEGLQRIKAFCQRNAKSQ